MLLQGTTVSWAQLETAYNLSSFSPSEITQVIELSFIFFSIVKIVCFPHDK